MKSFIVIGIGRFGNALARDLYKEGNDVLVIDENKDEIEQIANSVTHAIIGDAKDPQVLEQVGVRNFDCAIVSIAGDLQDSILVTLMLKDMGVKYVVAKARNEMHKKVLLKIGADKVVFPEHEMGERLAQLLSSDNVIDFLELSQEYSIMEINSPKAWWNKTLIDLDVRAKHNITVIAARDPQTDKLTVSLGPDFVISEGSDLIVLGANIDIKEISKL